MENRRTESEEERTSSKVSARKTGSSASTDWICVRTCGGDGGGIDLSTQVERKKLGGALVDVEVDLRNAGVGERFRAGIGNDADDGGPVRPGTAQTALQTDSLADRILALPIFAGPVHAGRGLVDDCDQGRRFNILVDKEASTQKSHAQQVEVFRRDGQRIDLRRLAALAGPGPRETTEPLCDRSGYGQGEWPPDR